MTNDREEWGPWIEHDGRGYPSGVVGQYVQAEEECVARGLLPPETGLVLGQHIDGGSWNWANHPQYTKILRYRVRKPRALRDLIRLAEDIPQQERIDA